MDIINVLKEFSSLNGPSGMENAAAQKACELLKQYTDEVKTDKLGNVIACIKCGKDNAKKVLLDAHLDEIGMVVTGQQDGFLRFACVGGIDPRMLPSREVAILADNPIRGVVTCLPPHVQTAAQMSQSVPVDKMFIDAGLSEQQAKELIPIGTNIVFDDSFCELANSIVSGKAMDDRACFTAIILTLEHLKNEKLDFDLYIMGSTQEEVGTRGAAAGVFSIAPDYAVAVDVTHAHTPDADSEKTLKFKGGPAVGYGPSMNRKMSKAFTDIAKEKDIPNQIEVMEGHTGTNGWPIYVSREGVPTSVLSIPIKYMHSPCETMAISDLENTASLLAEFLKKSGRWM